MRAIAGGDDRGLGEKDDVAAGEVDVLVGASYAGGTPQMAQWLGG